MDSSQSHRGIRNNKGKFVVLVFYILIVFVSPFQFFTPSAHHFLSGITHSLVSKDADQSFRQDIALLKKDNIDQVYERFIPTGLEPVSTSSLQSLAGYFASTTDQMQVVGGNYTKTTTQEGATTTYNVAYQIQNNDPKYPYVIAQIQAQDTGSGIQLVGITVNHETESVQESSKVNFQKQGIFLILALLIPLFITYTAFRYLQKAQKPKWILFLVILSLTVYFNFSSDNIGFHIGFNGFMAKSGEWGPWIFALPLPLGALYYYVVRNKHENFTSTESDVVEKIKV